MNLERARHARPACTEGTPKRAKCHFALQTPRPTTAPPARRAPQGGRSGTSPYSHPALRHGHDRSRSPAAPDHMELAVRRRVRKRDDPPQLRRARSPPGRRAIGALIQRFWRGYGRAIHQQLFHLLQNFEPHPFVRQQFQIRKSWTREESGDFPEGTGIGVWP